MTPAALPRDSPPRRDRALVPRPAWLSRFETRLGNAIPCHPHLLSGMKLAVVVPLLSSLRQVDAFGAGPALVMTLLGLFAALDYLDGVVARERSLESRRGRILDRVTDYPLLIGLSWFCADVVPLLLVGVKLALDLTLLALFMCGRGSTQNRLRTLLSTAAVFALLCTSQGWLPAMLTPWLVYALLGANVMLSATVVAFNLDLLKPHHIASLVALSRGGTR